MVAIMAHTIPTLHFKHDTNNAVLKILLKNNSLELFKEQNLSPVCQGFEFSYICAALRFASLASHVMTIILNSLVEPLIIPKHEVDVEKR